MDNERKEKSQNRGTGTDTPAIQAITLSHPHSISRRHLIAATVFAMGGACSFGKLSTGSPVPPLRLSSPDGTEANTASLGFPCLLMLFQPFCPACSSTLQALARLQGRLGPLAVHLLVEDTRRDLISLMPTPPFKVWFADPAELEGAFGRLPRPALFHVGPQGRVLKRQLGSRNDAALEPIVLTCLLPNPPSTDGRLRSRAGGSIPDPPGPVVP